MLLVNLIILNLIYNLTSSIAVQRADAVVTLDNPAIYFKGKAVVDGADV